MNVEEIGLNFVNLHQHVYELRTLLSAVGNLLL